jgi:hypothetical protein
LEVREIKYIKSALYLVVIKSRRLRLLEPLANIQEAENFGLCEIMDWLYDGKKLYERLRLIRFIQMNHK